MGVSNIYAIDHPGVTKQDGDGFPLISAGRPVVIVCDTADQKGVSIAVANLAKDFGLVCGTDAQVTSHSVNGNCVIIGTVDSPIIKQLAKAKKINIAGLKGKREMYEMRFVNEPFGQPGEALVVVGSDRRGAIYGAYELSEQIGVSPWSWWADVPVQPASDLAIERGEYTNGEPAVRYRGIFLNDEAPCLTGWVEHAFGTKYGGHEFYGKVYELILRLRGNFLWPAMWSWAFYADDPENGKLADEMGVVISTSHHEPMARNHQEYARRRGHYGPWNYATNQASLDQFFREGIERMNGTEDVVTIGMRGDGDEAMSAEADVALLEKVINNQRKIIQQVTGKPAKATPQVWALYKEVLDYYDAGLRVPDDVILLLCDDNWGNVRRLPNEAERKHPGGWGMYYHVDYVGAPRNTKWMNVTPIQGMWEQLALTYEYGVDQLWVLNVGDLKPMEYPITLFLDMAWNPTKYDESGVGQHTLDFCARQFGQGQAKEAARILNLYSKYNGRVTAEMLDADTYNLASGEWRQVRDEYLALEAEALRQYISLPEEYKDAYMQLVLFPVQAMANLYDMYYSVAMNRKLFADGNPQCNAWADRAEAAFARDAELMSYYNNVMADGKWCHMMDQKHIGYKSWNDDFPADRMPAVERIEQAGEGGWVFTPSDGVVAIEAEHFFTKVDAPEAKWTVIPDVGRTLSGITLMPRLPATDGASLSYAIKGLPADIDSVDVHVVVKSTLAFANLDGHRYAVGFEGADEQVINFNSDLNEKPENIYSIFYPTVARRVVENKVRLALPVDSGCSILSVYPLDPGVVFEKIVIDLGGYQPSYLYGDESPVKKINISLPEFKPYDFKTIDLKSYPKLKSIEPVKPPKPVRNIKPVTSVTPAVPKVSVPRVSTGRTMMILKSILK